MGDQPQGFTWHRALRGVALAVLSYTATWAIHRYDAVPSNHVTLWLAVLGMVAFVLWHGLAVTDRRVRRAAAGMAALFAFWLVLGREITTYYGLSKLHALDALWERLCMALGFAALFYALLALLLRRLLGGEGWGRASEKVFYHLGEGKGGFWLLTALFFACWLPYFLGLYPGLMTYDSFNELRQAAGTQAWNNFNPLIHTLMITACWKLGNAIGGQALGIGLYSVAQMVLMGMCFAYALRVMARARAHPALWWGAWAFFALSPVQGVYSVMMWKDVLFAGFGVALVTVLYEMASAPEAFFRSWRSMGWFVALSFLFCTWRNNGILAWILFAPLLLIGMRRYWKQTLALVGAVVACVLLFRGPVFWLMHVEEGPVAEALSIPAQQVARVMRDHGVEVSESDKAVIGEILPVDAIGGLYHPRIADYVKNRIDNDAFAANPGRYGAVWARLGVQFPESYVVAFLCNNFGYWYPDTEQWVVTVNGIMEGNEFGLINEPIVPLFSELREQTDVAPREWQGFRLLYSIAIMVWVEIFCAVVCVLKRRRDLLMPLALLGALWLTIQFTPLAAEYRYAYPLVLSAPVYLGIALAATRRDAVAKEVL